MIKPIRIAIVVLSAVGFTCVLPWTAQGQKPIAISQLSRKEPVSFEKEILPIFRRSCLACHSASERQGELVLESPAGILKGGDTGPAVVPGKSAESLLLTLASQQDDPAMPPPDNDVAAKPLTPDELGLIKLWIDQGAKGSALSGVLSPDDWRPLPAGNHPIYAVAVTPDGQFAACGRANQIFIYHVPTGQLITRLNDPELQKALKDKRPGAAHLDAVQSLAFSKQGDLLASGGFRTVKLWRYPRDVQRLAIQASAEAVSAVAVSPDRKTMATAGADHSISLWNLATGDAVTKLTGHAATVRSLRYSHDGSHLYSASTDKTIRAWSVSDGQLVGRIDTPTELAALTTLVQRIEVAEQPAPAAEQSAPAAEAQPAAETEPAEPELKIVERLASGGGDNAIRIWNVPQLPQPLAESPAKTNVLAVSADGSFLAMANAEGQVQVVDRRTGKTIHAWQAHAVAIHEMAFRPVAPPEPPPEGADAEQPAPQITQLATASADNTVRLWDFATGEVKITLRGSLTPIESIAFHPNGQQLVAGMADGKVTVWNLPAEASRQLDTENESPASVAAVSGDGKLLATGSVSNGQPAIVVRDLANGKILHTLLGHGGPISSLAFNGDGSKIVSGSADKTARVWQLSDAKFPEVSQFAGHTGAVSAVAFNTDATQVLSGSADNSLKLWTVADAKEVMDFAGHTAAVVAAAMTPANQPISASADKTVRVWNAADGKVARTITDPAVLTAMAITRDGSRIAAGGADNGVRVYQVSDGKLLHTLAGHADAVKSLAFSADNARLLSAASDNLAMVWNSADGRLLETLPVDAGVSAATYGPTVAEIVLADAKGGLQLATLRFALSLDGLSEKVTAVAFNNNGQLIYSACADGTVRGFNATNAQQTFSANHGAPVHDLALSADGQRLVSAGEDKLIKHWNAANGAAQQPPQFAGFAAAVHRVAFSPDAARVIGGSATGELLIFNSAGLEQSIVGHGAAVASLAAADPGTAQMLSASADGMILTWQPAAVGSLAGHTQPVTSLASIPNEPQQVLSGSLDGTIRRWNLTNGQALAQLNHGAPVNGVAIRGDAQRYASVSANNSVRLWNAANNGQLAEVRGDIRADTLVAKLTQQKTATTAKLTALKASLDAAEKDLPVKTAAEKTAADALAAATKDVEAKSTALAQTSSAKSTAEQMAIQMASAAQVAAQKMEEANQLALAMAADARLLADKAARAQTAAQSDQDNQSLAAAAAAAMKAAADADAKAKAAETAKAAPAQAAEATSKQAADAATKAVAMVKPFTDAATALAQSQAARDAAQQAHSIADRELKAAAARVPAAKAEVAKAEADLAKTDTDLAAATKAAADAQKPLVSVAFSPDGRSLATGGDLGVVHTWDADTGKPIASYVGHQGAIQDIAFASDDELVSAAADKQAVVWNLHPQWQLERVIGNINDPATLIDRVAALDFSEDGKLLAAGGGVASRGGEIKIFNTADGSLLRSMEDPHTDGVNAVAFSPDGEYLASASADKYVKKFSVATGEQLMQFEGHTNHVLGVSWRSGGRILASAGADSTIAIWNAENGDRIRSIAGYQKQVTSLRFIGQSQFVISSAGDPIVRMHNSDNGGVQRNFPGSADYMYAVDVTPDPAAGVVVAGGHDGVLRVWNTANGQALHQLAAPAAQPPSVVQAETK